MLMCVYSPNSDQSDMHLLQWSLHKSGSDRAPFMVFDVVDFLQILEMAHLERKEEKENTLKFVMTREPANPT